MRTHCHRAASARVGSTPEAQAHWMIDLAYRYDAVKHLSLLSSDNLAMILAELEAFLPEDEARPPEYARIEDREEYAIRWLTRIRNGVRRLNRGRAWGHMLVTHYSFWVSRPGQRAGRLTPESRLLKLEGGPEPHRLTVTKTPKDAMAHRICEVLAAVGNCLWRCHRPGCGRLFVRHKRQLYCTPSCVWVTRTRRHRQKRRSEGTLADGPSRPAG
jgi:hypothetical protein